MPRLLGIRFESVGHRDARLDGLVLPFDPEGAPEDSVLWLRNGGGKSSILNLIFSVLRPNLKEFLGSEADAKARRLEDYVGAGDTATVSLAWELDGDRGRCPVLFTTGVYYWSENEHTSLLRRWFALRVDPERQQDITLQSLPLVDESGTMRRPLRHAALRERLLELHSPPGATFTWVKSQAEWEELLESYGLDPQVFSYQLRMNRSEGAADHLFRHRSAEQLVDFLIEILLAPEEADAVRETLRQYAAQIARRPHLEREHGACGAAAKALHPLAVLATELGEARVGVEARATRLRAVLEAVNTADALRRKESEEIAESITRLTERLRQAGQLRNASQVNAAVFEAEAAARERADAQGQLRAAELERDGAHEQRSVLRAAERLAEVGRVDAELNVKRGELELRLDESRPLLTAIRTVATALASVLLGERERVEARTALAESAVARAQHELDTCRAKREGAVKEAAQLEERARSLDASLARSAAKWAALENRGDLLMHERPRAALARVRATIEQHEGAETSAREAIVSLDAQVREAQSNLVELRSEADQATRAREDLRRQLEAAERTRDALVNDETLCSIVGDDQPDVVRLGREIAARVRTSLGRLREQLLRLAVEAREDVRALDWLARHGLLPPTIDAETVRDELRRNGIHAHIGNLYLAENRRAEAAASTAAARPWLTGGVVVDAADEERARELLRTMNVKVNAPLGLGTTAALLDAADADPWCLLPAAGFWDRDAARDEHARRESDRDHKEARRVDCEKEESAAEALLRRLEAFVATHTEAWYATIREEIDRQGGVVGRAEADATALALRIEHLNTERATCVRDADRHAGLQKAAVASFARVEAFAEEGDAIDRVRVDLEEARRGRDVANALITACEDKLPRLDEAVRHRESQVQKLGLQAAALDAEVERLAPWIEPESATTPAPERSLAELRARFEHLLREYEERTAKESLQGEISALERQRDLARAKLRDASGRIAQTEIQRALDEAESGIGLEEAMRRADDAANKAERRVGTAQGDAKAAGLKAEAAHNVVQQLLDRGRTSAVSEARSKARDLDAATLRTLVDCERETATRASTEETECDTLRREAQARAAAAEKITTRLAAHRALIESEREHIGEIDAAARAFDKPTTTSLECEDGAALDAAVEAGVRETRDSVKHVRALLARVGDIIRQLAAFASSDEAASLPPMLRDRFREADVEVALRRASDLLADVETRRGAVAQHLEQLEQHRRLIAQGLGRTADKAIDLLRKLERSSLFPSHIEIWGDQPFLKVRLSVPESAAERDAAVLTVIDRAAAASQVPSALQLVQACVRELTRATGIRMSMLKPEVHRRLEWVPIEDINRFSGGERITAAILLYATLAQLRAKQRGKAKAPTSVLLLDNPVGACSHPEFLELQREMARASGLQLVYTTGVDDLEALARLRNIVRLRNAHRDTRGRRRVTIESPAIQAVHVAWTKD